MQAARGVSAGILGASVVAFLVLLAFLLTRAEPRLFSGSKKFFYRFSDGDLVPSYGDADLQGPKHEVKGVHDQGEDPALNRLLLRYTACTGLINQQYSHIAAFSLAAALRADIVLSPAAHRPSPGTVGAKHAAWSPAPTESLLDVAQITATWARFGITVHPAPQLTPFPDLAKPGSAYPNYTQQAFDPRQVARLEEISLQPRHVWELAALARRTAARAAAARAADQRGVAGEAASPTIVLDLPCSFFSIKTYSALPLVSQVALSLGFNPYLQALADRAVDRMTEGGRQPFNGLQLRVEKDAQGWIRKLGGNQKYWGMYLQAMKQAGFNKSTPVYVACGLLSPSASSWERAESTLSRTHGLASQLLSKEQYLEAVEMEGLHSEQLALLDFLILARAARFVGFGASTFSHYLREHRALRQGLPKATSVLVSAAGLGTDPLFEQAATLVEDLGPEQGVLPGLQELAKAQPALREGLVAWARQQGPSVQRRARQSGLVL